MACCPYSEIPPINYTSGDVRSMQRKLAEKRSFLEYLESNNQCGRFDQQIESVKNEINGLIISING